MKLNLDLLIILLFIVFLISLIIEIYYEKENRRNIKKMDEEIKEFELEYPELRLITEKHKIEFFNAINNQDKKEMEKACNLVIKQIFKDIKFTGNEFILVMVMNILMLEGVNEMLNLVNTGDFI